MIFVDSNGGQLCNRIWSYVSIIAYSKFYAKQLVLLDFDEYSQHFPNLSKNSLIHIFPSEKYGKVYKRISFVLKRLNLSSSFTYDARPKAYVHVSGWDFRFNTKYLSTETRLLIKSLFTPDHSTIEKCKTLIDSKRIAYDLIVGVHIRRGDYLEFADGKFYYSDADFLKFMKRILLLTNKRVGFLLCSNESINFEAFSEVNTFQIDDTDAIEDLYALSLCDYIIGPHSTYTMWSSFYGSTPLKLILNKDELFELDDFKVFLDD